MRTFILALLVAVAPLLGVGIAEAAPAHTVTVHHEAKSHCPKGTHGKYCTATAPKHSTTTHKHA